MNLKKENQKLKYHLAVVQLKDHANLGFDFCGCTLCQSAYLAIQVFNKENKN